QMVVEVEHVGIRPPLCGRTQHNREDVHVVVLSVSCEASASVGSSDLALALALLGGTQVFEEVVATHFFFLAATLEHQAGEEAGREVHGRCPWVMGLPPG